MKVRCSNNIVQINDGIFDFAKNNLGLDVDRAGTPGKFPYLCWDDNALARCNEKYVGQVMNLQEFLDFLNGLYKKTTNIEGNKIEIISNGLVRIGNTTFSEGSALQLAEYLKQNIKND